MFEEGGLKRGTRKERVASFVATLPLYKNVAVVSSRTAAQFVTSLTTDVFIRAP